MSPRPSRAEWRVLVLLGIAFVFAGCGPGFQPRNFANPEALFRASMLEFTNKHWDNAQLGFERLSNDLSARDPLLPTVFYYLALTHERREEFLLAAQAFQRLADGYPDDTLAAAAMLGTGRSYQRLWRKTVLDAEDGQKAAVVYRSLIAAYPNAKEVAEAKTRLDTLENWFAKKDYDTGVHYMKVRRTVDPAIIYFKDVIETYPETPTARLAWLRLHELYTKIRWKDDAADACTAMWKAYPTDPEVKSACGAPPAMAPASTPVKTPGSPVKSPDAYARPAP